MARTEKKIHYLYKTTCIITGRWYIGIHSTCNLDDGYMGSGRRLRASLRKHGVDNHTKEILEFFKSRELLIEAEIKAITEDMVLDENCMNLMGGGTGGYVSEEHYIKIREKSSKHQKEKWLDVEYRENILKHLKSNMLKNHSQETKNKLRLINIGKKHLEETKKKISETKKGDGTGSLNSQYGTCWITKDGTNKKVKKEDLDSYLNEGWVKGRK
jgi:hypothetical protein